MESRRFDGHAISISRQTSRRAAVGALIGFGAIRFAAGAQVAPDCLDDGARCGKSNPIPCCSGWCKRKHGSSRKTCKSRPDRANCAAVVDFCAGTGQLGCGFPGCFCFRSPKGAGVCASVVDIYPKKMCSFPGDKCTDNACRAALGDKRAFCVLNGEGCCGAGKTGACVLPCESVIA